MSLLSNQSDSKIARDLRADAVNINELLKLPKLGSLTGPGYEGILSYDKVTKSPFYHNGDGWSSLVNSGKVNYITWMPGGKKSATLGSTWDDMMSIIASLDPSSGKIIVCDPSVWLASGFAFDDPFNIPAGVYNMTKSMFYSDLALLGELFRPPNQGTGSYIEIKINPGVKLIGLREISGPIKIRNEATTTGVYLPRQSGAVVDIEIAFNANWAGATFALINGAFIENRSTAPFIEMTQDAAGLVVGDPIFYMDSTAFLKKVGVTSVAPVNLLVVDGVSLPTGPFIKFYLQDSALLLPESISTRNGSGTSAITNGGFKIYIENLPRTIAGITQLTLPFDQTYFTLVNTAGAGIDDEVSLMRTSSASHTIYNSPDAPTANENYRKGIRTGDIWVQETGGTFNQYLCIEGGYPTVEPAIWTQIASFASP